MENFTFESGMEELEKLVRDLESGAMPLEESFQAFERGMALKARLEKLLEEGKADYVLIARAAIADNNWVNKVKSGHEEDIRPCLRCNMCLDHGRRKSKIKGKELVMADEVSFDRRCAVNPLSMQGITKKKFPAPERRKKVVVVGGGVAGM